MKEKLHDKFLDELFKLLFVNINVLETCVQFFKFEYIPVQLNEYKLIWRYTRDFFLKEGKNPSFGLAYQEFKSSQDVLYILQKIENSNVISESAIISKLEDYIKDIEFQLLNERVFELYNDDKRKEAISYTAEKSKDIVNFSLKAKTGIFLNLFKDFNREIQKRRLYKEVYDRIPTGIKELDEILGGGFDRTDTALYVMRSGEGKSTWLRYTGFYAGFLGYKVLHFQLEASKQEAFDRYNQIWTGFSYGQLKAGNISEQDMSKLQQTINRLVSENKDITIYSVEKFEGVTIQEIRTNVNEYRNIYGQFPDLIIIDSLDLCYPGDGIQYGIDSNSVKFRLQKVAQLLKNLALECKNVILTSAQTSDVPYTVWNDPDKVIDRSYIEGDKTLIKPFSYVFTGNQTLDEKANEIVRIYIDKLRNYRIDNKIVYIKSKFTSGRFYDSKGTHALRMEFLKRAEKTKSATKKKNNK